MKKTYITPAIEALHLQTAQMVTASVGYNPNETSNVEARSKEFRGLSDEEDEDDSWF